jgi:hypothetical protein
MNIDYNESIKDIEFINMFPSMNSGGHVFIMTAITDKGNRILVYAPVVKLGEASINSYCDEDYSWRTTLRDITLRRHCQFMTEMFAVNSTNNYDEFFKIFYLDGNFKTKIKKSEIEKLFGCEIDG